MDFRCPSKKHVLGNYGVSYNKTMISSHPWKAISVFFWSWSFYVQINVFQYLKNRFERQKKKRSGNQVNMPVVNRLAWHSHNMVSRGPGSKDRHLMLLSIGIRFMSEFTDLTEWDSPLASELITLRRLADWPETRGATFKKCQDPTRPTTALCEPIKARKLKLADWRPQKPVTGVVLFCLPLCYLHNIVSVMQVEIDLYN